MSQETEPFDDDAPVCPFCGHNAEHIPPCAHLRIVFIEDSVPDSRYGKAPIYVAPIPEDYIDDLLQPFDALYEWLIRHDERQVAEMLQRFPVDTHIYQLISFFHSCLFEVIEDYESSAAMFYGESGDIGTRYAANVLSKIVGPSQSLNHNDSHIYATWSTTYVWAENVSDLPSLIERRIAEDLQIEGLE